MTEEASKCGVWLQHGEGRHVCVLPLEDDRFATRSHQHVMPADPELTVLAPPDGLMWMHRCACGHTWGGFIEHLTAENDETPRDLIALAAGAISDLLYDQKREGQLPPREAAERILEMLHRHIDAEEQS
ncbi:hypothetical protein ACFV42_23435 [Streptomyces solisilvae]|uniref:hypothetical protein n=1 Tax=Streptomyces malaysiensis TaxID=92644 RepID=UPI0036CE115F